MRKKVKEKEVQKRICTECERALGRYNPHDKCFRHFVEKDKNPISDRIIYN